MLENIVSCMALMVQLVVTCLTGIIHTKFENESASYKLDLVGEQGIIWDKGGTVRAGMIFLL
jgi:hypothetical protein